VCFHARVTVEVYHPPSTSKFVGRYSRLFPNLSISLVSTMFAAPWQTETQTEKGNGCVETLTNWKCDCFSAWIYHTLPRRLQRRGRQRVRETTVTDVWKHALTDKLSLLLLNAFQSSSSVSILHNSTDYQIHCRLTSLSLYYTTVHGFTLHLLHALDWSRVQLRAILQQKAAKICHT